MMKRFAFSALLAFAALPALASDAGDTTITANKLTYAQSFVVMAQGGGTQSIGAVGGKVDFVGPGPVFVSLVNGGQVYTSPTDQQGNYSFFIFVAYNNVSTNAWVAGQPLVQPLKGDSRTLQQK